MKIEVQPAVSAKVKSVSQEAPKVSAADAVSMALSGALPLGESTMKANVTLPIAESKAVAQGSIEFVVDTLRTLLRSEVDHAANSDFDQDDIGFLENYHRIMESAKSLNTLCAVFGLDSTHVSILMQEVAVEWTNFQSALHDMVPDLDIEEDDDEYEEEEDEDEEEDDTDPELDDEPAVVANDITVDARFLDTPTQAVCYNPDVAVYDVRLTANTASVLLQYIKGRIDAGNTADLVLFSTEGFDDDVLDMLSDPIIQGRVRVKPVTVDVEDVVQWAEQIGVQPIGAYADLGSTVPEGELPMITRAPRIYLGGGNMDNDGE